MPIPLAAYHFDWSVFWSYLWPPSAFHNQLISNGLEVTIYMAVLAQAIGVIGGAVGAMMQMSRRRVVRFAVAVYLLWFRGTPLLVQLSLLYFGLAGLGVYEFPAITIFGLSIPGAIQAGIIGLGANEAAYMTEIFRAGILSIDTGQTEAARALGMTFRTSMQWVILPQATRVIIPPLGNEFNNMLKSTTLVVVIGGVELFNAYEQVNAVVFKPFELFLAVSFYYLALTLIWGWIQSRIESRLGDRKSGRQRGAISRLVRGDTGAWRGFGSTR
jgi:polar amino acid transport system permease protein